MKKFITFASIAAAILMFTSCFSQKPAVTLSPSNVVIKVGEKVQLHPGTEGEASDLEISKVRPVQSTDEDVCYIDSYWNVTGVGKGTAVVGAAILNDEGKVLYSASTRVTVQ